MCIRDRHEEQAESGWEAAEGPETGEDEEVPDYEEPEGWDEDSDDVEAPAEDEGLESEEADEGCPGGCPDEEIPQEDGPESWEQDEDEAVSYTHLDVYKRQRRPSPDEHR